MKFPPVKTILICVGLFLLFFIIRFPMQNLRGAIFSKIYKETRISLTAEEMYLSLFGWPGIGMKNAEATLPVGRGDMTITCKKMVARVGLAGLFPPAPSVSLSCDGLKGGGDLWLKVSQSKSAQKVKFDFDAVELSQFVSGPAEQAVRGKVTGDGNLELDPNDLSKSTGKMDLDIAKLQTPAQNYQGIVFPNINFGNLKSKLTLKNGLVEVGTFQIGDPKTDISGSINGDVRLGRDIYASYLNLTLRLKLTDAFRTDPNSATIVSILDSIDKSNPGTYAMKWSTSIQGIVTNLFNALPQRVIN